MKIIYHISDLHICHNREKEFKYVWDGLIKNILDEKEFAILVICGDILETKYKAIDADIELLIWMILELSKNKIETLIIPSKGDYNPFKQNQPLFSSILKLTDKYVHTLVPGSVKYNDYIFHVCVDKREFNPHIDESKINILLYHGTSETIIDKFMSFCKIGLLGGYHSYSTYKTNKSVAWSGSLIQLSASETHQKVCLRWDIKSMSYSHIRLINNIGGFMKLSYNDNKLVSKIDTSINPTSGIFLDITNCTSEFVNAQVRILESTYKSSPIKYVFTDGSINSAPSCFSSFLDSRDMDDKTKKDLINIHESFMEHFDITTETKVNKWKLQYLEWTNLFRYGETNHINFNDFKGLIGLTGKNGIGKSALIDILIFILYNHGIRGVYKTMVRKSCKDCVIKCIISIDDVKYTIIRNNAKVSLLKGNVFISRDGTKQTYIILKSLIGNYSDFIDKCIIQQEGDRFSSMTPQTLSTKLIKLFRLDILTEIPKLIKSKIKDLRDRKNELLPLDNIDQIKEDLSKLVIEKKALDDNIISKQESLDALLKEKDSIHIKMEDISDEELISRIDKLSLITSIEPIMPHISNDTLKPLIERFKATDNSDEFKSGIISIISSSSPLLNEINDQINTLTLKNISALSAIEKIPIDIESKLFLLPSLQHINIKNESVIKMEIESLQKEIDIFKPSKMDVLSDKDISELTSQIETIKAQLSYTKSQYNKEELQREILSLKLQLIPCVGTESRSVPIKNYPELICKAEQEIKTLKVLLKPEPDEKLNVQINECIKIVREKLSSLKTISIGCATCNKYDSLFNNSDIIDPLTKMSTYMINCTQNIQHNKDIRLKLITVESELAQYIKSLSIIEENKKIDFNMEINKSIKEIENKIELADQYDSRISKLSSEYDLLNSQLIYDRKVKQFIKCKELIKLYEDYSLKIELQKYAEIKIKNDANKQLSQEILSKLNSLKVKRDHLQSLLNSCNELQKYIDNYIQFRDASFELNRLKSYSMGKIQNKLQNEKLHSIVNQIESIRKVISDQNKLLKKYDEDIIKIMDKIRISSNNADEVKDLDSKIQLYKLYKTTLLSAPSMDLKSTCEKLSTEMNTVLIEITDFTVSISLMETTGQLLIELRDAKSESVHISMASGFQKLIFDLLFRIVLTKMIQASISTFFIIDDCFGTGDSEHIKKITSSLKTYKSGLDWILIIGQNEELMYCDSYISISQQNEISRISHGEEIVVEIKTPTSPASPASTLSTFIIKDNKLYCTICKKSFVAKTETFKLKHIKSKTHLKLVK